MFREDPLWLAVQAARRFAPARRFALTPRSPSRGLLAAAAAFVADQPDRTAALLRERSVAGRRPCDALAARLAVQVGASDALSSDIAARPDVAALVAQQKGDLTGALAALVGNRAAARKLRSEWRTLQPGFRLPVPRVEWDGPGDGVRVLHVLTNSLPHTRSGYTNRTHHLLRALRDAGVTVEAVTRIGYPTTVGVLGSAEADVMDGITYRRLPAWHLETDVDTRLSQQVQALIPIVRRFRPGVLHTTTDYTNALVTQALAEALGVPWVYEMRGRLELTWVASRPAEFRGTAGTSERVRLLRAKEAELAQAADAVVVLSQVQADDLVARGVNPDKLTLVPNAIDPQLLSRDADPAEARQALGLPREGVWVGTVSSLVAYEGIDDLLRAVALLRAEGLDVRALVAGDGVSRPAWVTLADKLGLGDVVVFPGRVAPAEAPCWFEALDIFTVPRKNTPVCRLVTPLKPVEAMALRRPVVASDLPALREIVAHEAHGAVFRAEDPSALAATLKPLIVDPTLRSNLAAAGHEGVAQRTWAADAATLLQRYLNLRG
jgi:glycosyltransferase involved in cell wall biosynthesis